MKVFCVVLALSLLCGFAAGATPAPICGFDVDPNDGTLRCPKESQNGYCVIRLKALYCLQQKENNGEDIPPIKLAVGEEVYWRGEYKPANWPKTCNDSATKDCPRFYFSPFSPVPKGDDPNCNVMDSTAPFENDFSDENPGGGKPKKFDHSKSSLVSANVKYGACYKHNINLEGPTPNDPETTIDPHIIIGGISLEAPGGPSKKKTAPTKKNTAPAKTQSK